MSHMPDWLAYWIQFLGTVATTSGATYMATEPSASGDVTLLPAYIAAIGAAVAMAQKSMNDPRRKDPTHG